MGCFLYILGLIIALSELCIANNEDAELTVPELIVKYGYPVEEHTVTTDDGYILTLHRIPHGKNSILNNSTQRPVVFLQHGILATSDAWVLIGPTKGLAYCLADEGYDVWMGNSRGNTYSKNHIKLKPNGILTARKYWNFSFHELGVYDLATSINYILNITNLNKLSYIAHSQGCAIFYVLCSEKPEYNDKINAFFGMAPAVFLSHHRSLFFSLCAFLEKFYVLRILTEIIGAFELLPHNELVSLAAQRVCSNKSILQVVCVLLYNSVGGYNPKETNSSLLPAIFGHFPAGCSSKQLINYIQEVNSGKFRRYDYSSILNIKRYGVVTPPEYDIKKTRVPAHLYYGNNDLLVQPTDVKILSNSVANLQSLVEINSDGWAHNDFVYGKNVKQYVYDILIPVLNSYNNIIN